MLKEDMQVFHQLHQLQLCNNQALELILMLQAYHQICKINQVLQDHLCQDNKYNNYQINQLNHNQFNKLHNKWIKLKHKKKQAMYQM